MSGITPFNSIALKRLRHSKSILLSAIVTFTIIMAAFTGCSSVSQSSEAQSLNDLSNTNDLASSSLYDENTIVSLYEQAIPSLVKIEVIEEQAGTIGPFNIGPFQQKGQGSGFIIDEQGHILTNNHVVEGASSVKITINNGDVIDAEVVGTDRENDLALLKVDTGALDGIAPLTLGNSDNIKPGQMAIALGSPFGLDGSITVGVVSGTGRSLTGETQHLITNIIQTDAAINPGNSGGPLLNSTGEVIGINTAIEASGTGIGFAIPINTVKSLLPALLEGGEISNAWLGISGTDIDEEFATMLDLTVNKGVYVIGVTHDSPAEKAGLRGSGTDESGQPTYGGDIITGVDGQTIIKVEELIAYFNSKKPGDEVSLSIQRGDQVLTVEVILGEWPEQAPTS